MAECGHDHGHDHGHGHNHVHHHKLDVALGLTLLFAIVELIGGLVSNSLALLADAAHMTSDVIALALAAFAGRLALRPAHSGMTYGYGRARVLAAQLNGFALWFLSGWIAWEATGRLAAPPVVQGNIVIAIGTLGLAVNLVILKWLHGEHDINSRAAYWHVAGDALGSVAAVIAGVTIYVTGWMPIDPILSFLVAAILAWGGWRLIRETTSELMEAVPDVLDHAAVEACLKNAQGVSDIHHTHLWTLPDGRTAISAHVEIESIAKWDEILPHLLEQLHKHGVEHATLQPESSHLKSPCRGHHC
ncbi:MAG: cation transporter [Zetaproteobacteria bacterium CG12_big_fil_rev_8_21_14_0_65_54_13]|nr:MAG: cation transporter [Zetaproteobacteria bacterium CG12_big_fil_rev_8_21_14_0_65_54_13]PIX54094.1 MAG: cation transporter [Zetaproteobacteria bacterium CG_4_10_14_3_um_filter_54_28]PJA27167.1 MAG: cation transporter [Zetaproteobacteria bacterium CG_4_9_14_3_um_filter_54_145]